MSKDKALAVSWVSLWRILFFVSLAAITYFSLRILLGLFLALVISSGLEFMVNFLERRGVPRTLGVVIIFVLSALLIIVTVYTVIPLIIIDLNSALLTLDKTASQSWWGTFLSFKTTQSVSEIINSLMSDFFAQGTSPLSAVSNVLGGVALTVSILVSSFYLSLSRDGVERFIRAVLPADYEDSALKIYERSGKKIGNWFRSQILLSLTMGVLVLIALLILGVKYELVPFIGPILAGSAATIIALTASPTLALYTLIIFVVLHQIESHLLIPIIVGRSVGLHPVLVIIALLIGFETAGFLGILIAVPAAVILQEVVENWSSKKDPSVVTLPII